MAVSTPYEKTGEISCSENLTGCGQSIREVTRMADKGMGGLLADFSQIVGHLGRVLRPGTGLGADVGGGVDGLAVGFCQRVAQQLSLIHISEPTRRS